MKKNNEMKMLMREWRAFELETIVEQSKSVDAVLPDELKGKICAGNQIISWRDLKDIVMTSIPEAAEQLGRVDQLRDPKDFGDEVSKKFVVKMLKSADARSLIAKTVVAKVQEKLNVDELRGLLVPQLKAALTYSGTAQMEELPDPRKYAVDSIITKAFSVISSEKYLKPKIGKLLLAVADNIESSGHGEYDAWINKLDQDLAKLIIKQTGEQGSLIKDAIKVLIATKVFSYRANELLDLIKQKAGKHGPLVVTILGAQDGLREKKDTDKPAFSGLDAVTEAAIADLGIVNKLSEEGLCGFLSLYEEIEGKKWSIAEIEATFPATWDALVTNNKWLAALGRGSPIIELIKSKMSEEDKQAVINNTPRGQKLAAALMKKSMSRGSASKISSTA